MGVFGFGLVGYRSGRYEDNRDTHAHGEINSHPTETLIQSKNCKKRILARVVLRRLGAVRFV